ncbi:L-glutaminase [Nocardia tenerifensis]|uniref:Glutaminase n=1 Tax=Nocardia tenerifensis TaxID=228006 RepID=A0A318KBY1_9NOCA|nr:glutaminase A [Nocardia tenerifensis]PXX71626.1 L-glutaminase [Nocardia tenerifensis]
MDDPVTTALTNLLHRLSPNHTGTVADYIPELASVDPNSLGAAMVSLHGDIYHAGDSETEFTIQSVSKPFVYALALSDLGLAAVTRHVGFEPSGEPFNAISLEPDTGRPANPLINAGAIVTTALVAGADRAEKFARIQATLFAFAGRELGVDEAVYASESATGDRNRALAYLTLSQGVLAGPVEEVTDTYFRQCALRVTAIDLAVMAATLANGGVNPVTKRSVIDAEIARITLSVMSTCGMYDASGEWMVQVGLPAKSGVGGGIVSALPGEFGIGVFSPRLDAGGNSVRGKAALHEMSQRFGLHVFTAPTGHRSPIAASDLHDEVLNVQLQGEVDFISAERIVRHLQEMAATYPLSRIDLDLTHVTTVQAAGSELLTATFTDLRSRDIAVRAISPDPSPLLELG